MVLSGKRILECIYFAIVLNICLEKHVPVALGGTALGRKERPREMEIKIRRNFLWIDPAKIGLPSASADYGHFVELYQSQLDEMPQLAQSHSFELVFIQLSSCLKNG